MIVYYAFDLLYLDGRDLTMRPLVERKAALRRILSRGTRARLRYTDHIVGDGRRLLAKPKTSQSRRTLPLPASIVRDLGHHKARQAEARLKCGARYQALDLVFATETGGPLHSENLATRNFRAIRHRAKLPSSITLQSQAYCATLLLLAGENPKVVSERLGHSSIVMTLDTYSHVLPLMQQAATEKLEKMLFVKLAHYRHTKQKRAVMWLPVTY